MSLGQHLYVFRAWKPARGWDLLSRQITRLLTQKARQITCLLTLPSQDTAKLRYNKWDQPVKYVPGATVLLQTQVGKRVLQETLLSRCAGPFAPMEYLSDVNYDIACLTVSSRRFRKNARNAFDQLEALHSVNGSFTLLEASVWSSRNVSARLRNTN